MKGVPMKRHIALLATSIAAAAVFLALAGQALAAQTFSGTVPNGGCGAVHPVNVAGPSRIEVSVASNGADNESLVTQVLAPGGRVVSEAARYDAPSGGLYGVRVCYLPDGYSTPTVHYSGMVATGPLG